MRKFKIKVDGKLYEVEVEEVGESKSLEPTIPSPAPVAKEAKEVKEEPAKPKPSKDSNNPTPSKTLTSAVSGEEVTAPMPGKILQLRVAEGDSVKEGDTLLILEAMKMENEIVANSSGNIKKIYTVINSMVDTGDILMVIG